MNHRDYFDLLPGLAGKTPKTGAASRPTEPAASSADILQQVVERLEALSRHQEQLAQGQEELRLAFQYVRGQAGPSIPTLPPTMSPGFPGITPPGVSPSFPGILPGLATGLARMNPAAPPGFPSLFSGALQPEVLSSESRFLAPAPHTMKNKTVLLHPNGQTVFGTIEETVNVDPLTGARSYATTTSRRFSLDGRAITPNETIYVCYACQTGPWIGVHFCTVCNVPLCPKNHCAYQLRTSIGVIQARCLDHCNSMYDPPGATRDAVYPPPPLPAGVR